MAEEGAVQNFDILLAGKIDPSVIKSINETEAKLKGLGASARTQSAAMRQVYKLAFEGMGADVKKTERVVEESSEKMRSALEKVLEPLKELPGGGGVSTIAGMVSQFGGLGIAVAGAAAAGTLLANTVEKVTETMKEMADKAIEFTGESIGIHATREAAGAKLSQILRNQGRGGEQSEINETIERFASSGANVTYASALNAATMLEARQRLSPEELQARLGALANVSGGTQEGFDRSSEAYGRILATGRIMPKSLAQIGGGIPAEMAKLAGTDLAGLQKMFGPKGAYQGAKGIELLNKAIEELSKTGAAGLAASQLSGLTGIFHGFNEDMEGIKDKWGQFWETIISPIAHDFLDWFEAHRSEIDGAFEKLNDWGKGIGEILNVMAQQIEQSGIFSILKQTGEEITKFISSLVGFDYDKMIDKQSEYFNKADQKWHIKPTAAGEEWHKEWEQKMRAITKVFEVIADISYANVTLLVDALQAISNFISNITNIPDWVLAFLPGGAAAIVARHVEQALKPTSPSGGGGGGGNGPAGQYAPSGESKGLRAALNLGGVSDAYGINKEAWAAVMAEEGDTPNPTHDKEYQSIYGASSSQFWPGRSVAEDAAFDDLHKYGAHSPQGVAALQRFWKTMFQGVDTSGVHSVGLQAMMLADIQHRGGKKVEEVLGNLNKYGELADTDEKKAIDLYESKRGALWAKGDTQPVDEYQWALKHLGKKGGADIPKDIKKPDVTQNVTIHVHDATDPHRVAKAVNDHLHKLRSQGLTDHAYA